MRHASVIDFGGRPDIDETARIDAFCVLSTGPRLSIGRKVHLGVGCRLFGASARLIVGDYANLSPGVTIFTASDDFASGHLVGAALPDDLRRVITGDVLIHPFAAVGVNATIMPGVTIGWGAAVGAHSFVPRDVPAGVIVAGTPARPIGRRDLDRLRALAAKIEQQFGPARQVE